MIFSAKHWWEKKGRTYIKTVHGEIGTPRPIRYRIRKALERNNSVSN